MNTDLMTMTTAQAGVLDLSKTRSAELTEQVVQCVEDGEIRPLDALAKLSWLSQTIDGAIKKIRPLATDEAERDYAQKEFGAYGVRFQVKEAGVRYDYSDSDEWLQLQAKIDDLELERKQLEERLRHKGQAFRTSTTTVSVMLKK